MFLIKPQLLTWITRALPNFLWPVKWLLLKKSLKEVGRNFHFGPNSVFSDHRLIEIGNNVFFGDGIVINSQVPVKIGNGVMFGPEVMIIGGDHNFRVVGMTMNQVKVGGVNLPIIIEDDVWLGSRVIILKGIKIGEGTVVGAGSIVTKSLPPYSICVGNPCKPLHCRYSIKDLKKHLSLVNSHYNVEDILQCYQLWNIDLQLD
jgi:acetyltransferase-like isoleucine patch superfamily enzyme